MQVQHQPVTLRGVFPERIVHKKNFIKENVRKIRQMQEYNHTGNSEPKLLLDKAPKLSLSKQKLHDGTQPSAPPPLDRCKLVQTKNPKPGIQKLEIRTTRKSLKPEQHIFKDEKFISRYIQTEATTDLDEIYATGVLKYATQEPAVNNVLQKRRVIRKRESGNGDSPGKEDNSTKIENDPSKTDYVKQNMSVRSRIVKQDTSIDPNKVPANYKKGVVPRYIKLQKKENSTSEDTADVDCPAGHVLLPEEERKETLRVLRESYAEKIQELNAMPVRSDTLRMQKRKIELEEELNKIDEGIKVFQRPKVFVKINV